MAYTPTNWQDGEVITAAKLNRLEQGLAAIQAVPDGGTVDLSAYALKANPEFTGSISMERSGAVGNYSAAMGLIVEASGEAAHAEGTATKATAQAAHAEGGVTEASGMFAHSEGLSTIASGAQSHAEGYSAKAAGDLSHAEGHKCTSSGYASHAEGHECTASGYASHAGGYLTEASGQAAFAQGQNLIADGRYQAVFGLCNVSDNISYLIIGSGTLDPYDETVASRSNCFRVTTSGVYAAGAYNSSGADYAEMFEWADGNPDAEDRAGRFVTLDGEKLRLAGPEDDYILGIVSAVPSIVGDVYDDQWAGMHVVDVFGRPIWEDVEFPAKILDIPDPKDPKKTIQRTACPAHTERCQRLNPAYDGARPYIPRSGRPEWDAVGLLGKLVAVDDGTCAVNGYAAVGPGGVASASAERTRYRVMARLDDTHVRLMIL